DERPDARVTGVDESEDALALARENAECLGLDVELRAGGLESAQDGWDLVVSNPPYVDTLEGLQPELRYEPEVALVGSGMHERLAEGARTRAIVLEVGAGQADRVAAALETFAYKKVRITRDLSGIARVVEGER
ncbi:MAG: methyltransferase domain-containing protein, partial [Gaiellaceae bacterium]